MPFFNPVPSPDQLAGITYRNLAGLQTGKFQTSDDRAFYILQDNPPPKDNNVLGFPTLLSAAQHLVKDPLLTIGTMDTDGVLVKAEKSHFERKCEAIKAVVVPSIFPAKGRLERATDNEGLQGFSDLFQQNLFHLLGISISSDRLPRQPKIKEMYQNAGAKDYICGLPRNEVPHDLNPITAVWSDFLKNFEAFKELGPELQINYNHFFDIWAPIKMMAFNNGEEGIFAKWAGNLLSNLGMRVQTSLIEFNPYFPQGGLVMGSDLEFKPLT